MINARLTRISSTKEFGTFGVLAINGLPFCVTLERYVYGNKRNKSCIPSGQYLCKRVNSQHFGSSFEVTEVENRNSILFHKGNTKDDSSGCILLGTSYGQLGDKFAILNSTDAVNAFNKKLKNEEYFSLVIDSRY